MTAGLKPQTTELTIAQQGVTPEAVAQRIARNRTVVAVRSPGVIDVYRRSTGEHLARYLITQRVLWHRSKEDHAPEVPRDWLREYTGPWPPNCPICGVGPMIPKHKGPDRVPFWSCRNWSKGWGCRGATDFFPHPDDYNAHDGDMYKAIGDSLARLAEARRQAALEETR